MASLSIPNSFTNNTVASATEVNSNFLSVKSFAEAAVVQVDGSVQAPTVAIANLAVTTAKIADLNVTTGKIADLNVTTGKIADLNVTTGKIAASAVTKEKIGSGPRGIVAFGSTTTSDATITGTQEIQISSSSFTAVAGRYYRITYYEPLIVTATNETSFVMGIIAISGGLQLETSLLQNPRTGNNYINGYLNTSIVTTLPAGSTVINGILFSNLGTAAANRYSTQPAWLCVEDIGTI